MTWEFYFNVKMLDDDINVEDTTHELCKVLKFLYFGWIVQFFFFFFFQVGAQFKINGIFSGENKFKFLVSQLEHKYVENIRDIVTNNSTTKYSESKTRPLDLFNLKRTCPHPHASQRPRKKKSAYPKQNWFAGQVGFG